MVSAGIKLLSFFLFCLPVSMYSRVPGRFFIRKGERERESITVGLESAP